MKVIRPIKPGVFPQLTPGHHNVALGNMTQYSIVLAYDRGEVFIGIEGKGCYRFNHTPDPGYLGNKLNIGEGDAANVCDFVTCQLYDVAREDYIPQGNYYGDLLEGSKNRK